MYDALLLDHDGVIVDLLDLEALHAGILTHGERRFRELGVDPDDSLLEVVGIGASTDQMNALADRHGVDPAALWRCRDDASEMALREATYDGEKNPYEDVTALDRVTLPMGIASNNQRRIVEFILDHHGLSNLFDTLWAREPDIVSLERKKPAPTYLEGAMRDMAVEQPLYVGDSETDVIAAQRAGIDCAFIRRSHNTGVELSVEPAYEVSGLDDVVTILHDRDGTRVDTD